MEQGQASQGQGGLVEGAMRAAATVERLCELARVSRAGYYRWWSEKEPKAEQTEVRAAIQETLCPLHQVLCRPVITAWY